VDIKELGLSLRAYHCLKRSHVDTIEQLQAMNLQELLSLRGLGIGCASEITDKLSEYAKKGEHHNGFPAILHQDERILTASEARAQDGGSGGTPISIQIGTLSVREEADVDRIAVAFYEQMKLARMAG